MPRKKDHTLRARQHGSWILLAGLLALAAVILQSSPPGDTVRSPAPEIKNAFLSQLTAARIDTAKIKIEQNRPDEALALLISALKADPASDEARELVGFILSDTSWNLPVVTIQHPMPVEQIAFASPSSLWVSLAEKNNTTLRWDLESLEIESVLFPTYGGETRSLVFDPTHQYVVVERKSVTLLCNAQTLKPIRELGSLPDECTPSSVIVFSNDGLLLAHPSHVSATDRSIVWQIRDSASGEIIRTTEANASDAPLPLAAYLNRERLRVLDGDGTLQEIPVSPVLPILTTPASEPVKILQAQFSSNGNSVLTLQDSGPHLPPTQTVITYGGQVDSSLETDSLARRFPWNRHPNMWTSLMKDPEHLPFTVEGNLVQILTNPHAPIETESQVTALAFDESNVIIGEKNGTVSVHRLLPLPDQDSGDYEHVPIDMMSLKSLEMLGAALTGIRFDEARADYVHIPTEERVKSFGECDFDALFPIFPELDFSALIATFQAIEFRTSAPQALAPLTDRLAQAAPARKSDPGMEEVKAAFSANDSAAVQAAIQTAGDKGPALATALALALKSERADWIAACLEQAADLPPLLRRIAQSRIAWLQGRKADALSGWPEVFPDLWDIRLREDWSGWEQADFRPALQALSQCITEELDAIKVPEDSTPEQRLAVADRLTDPATIAAVGKPRYAEACLAVALAFSAHDEEFSTTSKLARYARYLGAPQEPCLRTEALALTAMGDFHNARSRWVELLTEHPPENHLPGDYAEAAYTSFENGDPGQAIEILNTGMRHFDNDGNFALRAGWVALLTGNSERAYRYLLLGKRSGFPSDKVENATALLTIAAAQTGATADAEAFYQELLLIDPAWETPETIDSLDWPEELKLVLMEFTQPLVTPDLLPELEPTTP